jgi:excisionase family DNA binding protein
VSKPAARQGTVQPLGDADGVSTREAAAALGIPERTIRRAVANGDLVAVRHRGAYRIYRASLERYAERHPRQAQPPPAPRLLTFPGHADLHVVPERLSTFVGRQAEVAGLQELLATQGVRLVTLTGAGGIGKTRLALTLAGCAPQALSRDGVVFVALADIQQPGLVLPAIADALGLPKGQAGDVRAQIGAFLQGKHLLLILDNFEHLLAASPVVVQLLQDAPHLTVLVTSRAPLRIAGERIVAVPPLHVATAGATPESVRASDAGRLFLERAAEHGADVALDASTAPLIAAICARLEGLPLAIELAAARTPVLSPGHLLRHLERRLPVLTRGPRDAPTRHSTMRHAIAWSYDSLSAPAQGLFRQLSVFPGGVTLAAATAMMTALDPESAPQLVDLLAELLDHSLVTGEDGPDGARRFRMLETIREFGLEHLAPDEAVVVRQQHAAFFAEMSRSLRATASTHVTPAPFVALRAEYPNLQDALRWLQAHGPAGAFVALVADLCEFWYASSYGRDATMWIPAAMQAAEQAAPLDRGRLLVGQAALLLQRGEMANAEPLLADGVGQLRAAGDPLYLSRGLVLLAVAAILRGEFPAAETALLEALVLADALEDASLRAGAAGRALTNLSAVARAQGDLDRATAYGEEALHRYAGHAFAPVQAMTLISVGATARDAGDLPLALERSLAGIHMMGEHGDLRQIADALSGIGCIAAAWGEPQSALRLLGAAEAVRQQGGAAMVWAADIAAVERCEAALRVIIPEPAFSLIRDDGRDLSLAAAVTLAESLSRAPALLPAGTTLPEPLTRREQDVLRLLVQHKTDREIADALYLSARTVNWHVRSILGKLGVATRRELIALTKMAASDV